MLATMQKAMPGIACSNGQRNVSTPVGAEKGLQAKPQNPS